MRPLFHLLTIVLFTSCSTISYIPRVVLDVSSQTITANVQVDKFVDNTPAKEKRKPVGGVNIADSRAMTGDLALELTQVITQDLKNNAVFSNVGRRVPNADYIMKGEIVSFKGKYKPTALFWITLPVHIVTLCCLPFHKEDVNVELKVSVYKKSGELVKTYAARSSLFHYYSLYYKIEYALPSDVNRCLSKAVEDIRTQLLADVGKY